MSGLVHLFPGNTTPKPGDKALCGYMLWGPFKPMEPGSRKCPTCKRLEANQ